MATAFAAVEVDLDRFIDLDRYPIHDLTNPTRCELVDETRRQMQSSGCCRISGFVRPVAIAQMRAEANQRPADLCWPLFAASRDCGAATRYIGLPTYVHDPYRMNQPYHSASIYGRATNFHHERARVLVDGLAD